MKYPFLSAFALFLTTFVGWIPLGLGSFGSFIIIGMFGCFLPTFLVLITFLVSAVFFRRTLQSLSILAISSLTLMAAVLAILSPLVIGMVPFSDAQNINSGFLIASLIFLGADSAITAKTVKQKESEQGGDGDAEEAV